MNQTVLITGAGRGIGLELSKLYKQQGDHVIGTCRTAGSEIDSLGIEVIDGVDVSVPGDVESLAARRVRTGAYSQRALVHRGVGP